MGNHRYLRYVGDRKISSPTLPMRIFSKLSIIGGDLNLLQADWQVDTEKASGFQAFVNNLVWVNGYTEVVSGPTRGDALLYIYPLRPESSLISFNNLPGISDLKGVLLEAEWNEFCREPKVERIVPMYHKTDAFRVTSLSSEKFNLWPGNGSCVEEMWKSYKDVIFEVIKRYVPKKF